MSDEKKIQKIESVIDDFDKATFHLCNAALTLSEHKEFFQTITEIRHTVGDLTTSRFAIKKALELHK